MGWRAGFSRGVAALGFSWPTVAIAGAGSIVPLGPAGRVPRWLLAVAGALRAAKYLGQIATKANRVGPHPPVPQSRLLIFPGIANGTLLNLETPDSYIHPGS